MDRPDYSGAVYGSLLAASVIVGSAVDGDPLPAERLVALILGTSVVFWLTHVYTSLVNVTPRELSWRVVRDAFHKEKPVFEASLPPAVGALVASAVTGSAVAASWTALVIAVASQVAWAVGAAVTARSSPRVIVLSGVINLALGLVMIGLKTVMISH